MGAEEEHTTPEPETTSELKLSTAPEEEKGKQPEEKIEEEAIAIKEEPKKEEADGKKKKGKKEKEPQAPYGQLFRYADGWDKIMMFFGSIFAMGAGAAMPVMSIVFGDVVNIFLPENLANPAFSFYDEMTATAIIFLYFAVGNFVASYIQTTFWTLSAERQLKRIREHYLKAVLYQDIGWYDTTRPSELSSRIANDTLLMQDAMGEKVGQLIQHNCTFLAGLAVGFAFGWQLTLVILALVPLIGAAGGFAAKAMSSFTVKQQQSYAKAGGAAEETISGVRTVSTFSGEEKEARRFEGLLKEGVKMGFRNGYINAIGFGAIMMIIYCTYSLAFWYGAKLITDQTWNGSAGHTWNGGDVVTVFFAVLMGTMGVGNTSPSVAAMAQGRAAALKVFEVIDRQSKIDASKETGAKLDRNTLRGEVEFRDVDFNYPSRANVEIFKGFNLLCKAGQTTALVGDSGGGKSTVIGLLERFYDPAGGAVLLDGVDLKDINLHSLRSTIGLVSQEPVLFAGTIEENIRMGKPGATIEEIVAASTAANAHGFISAMPDGYKTMIGEKGAQISGGQKQRIAIARAVIKNPAILLLDEATSALDAESEAIVQDALDKLMVGRTTIVIAHRLTTIRNAHSIAAVRKGKVVEQGTHDELLAQNGLYAELHNRSHATKDQEAKSEQLKAELKEKEGAGAQGASSSSGADVEAVGPDADRKKVDISMRRLLSYSAPEKWVFIIGAIGAAAGGVVQPIYAIIFAEMLKVFQSPDADKRQEDAVFWALMFFVIAVGSAVAIFVQISMFTRVGEILTSRLRSLTFRAILRQEIGFFDREENRTGTLAANLATDATQIRGLTTLTLGIIVQNAVALIVGIIIAIHAGWKLALVVLTTVPVIVGAAWVQMNFLRGAAAGGKDAYGPAGQVATEAIGAIRTVISFCSEGYILNKFSEQLKNPYQVGLRRAHISGFAVGFSNGVMFCVNCLAFWYGGKLIDEGEWTATDEELATCQGFDICIRTLNYLAGFQVMMRVFIAVVVVAMGLGRAFSFMPDLTKAQDGARSIFSLLDRKTLIDPTSDAGETIANVKGEIEFKDVHFAYPTRRNKPVFKGINLQIPAGKTLALVGDSGGGKSTIIQMLERFYDPISGSVTLDGIDIRNLNIKFLRQTMGLVSQEPTLFDSSILNNIKYGKENATMEEVIAAARAANAHDFISALPEGYNTPLGDKFTQLSGGQKQRVAIARAILRDPKVLLLDEATSALDSQSEKLVQGALDNLMNGRTAVVIAHRLSTVRNAHMIAVLKQGAVVELGTHNELIERGGAYFQLVQRQL